MSWICVVPMCECLELSVDYQGFVVLLLLIFKGKESI